MKFPAPNRIAVYLAGAGALATAAAPVVADLDLTSTAGIIGGLAALTAVVDRFLKGWQAHEVRTFHYPEPNLSTGDYAPPDPEPYDHRREVLGE